MIPIAIAAAEPVAAVGLAAAGILSTLVTLGQAGKYRGEDRSSAAERMFSNSRSRAENLCKDPLRNNLAPVAA